MFEISLSTSFIPNPSVFSLRRHYTVNSCVAALVSKHFSIYTHQPPQTITHTYTDIHTNVHLQLHSLQMTTTDHHNSWGRRHASHATLYSFIGIVRCSFIRSSIHWCPTPGQPSSPPLLNPPPPKPHFLLSRCTLLLVSSYVTIYVYVQSCILRCPSSLC